MLAAVLGGERAETRRSRRREEGVHPAAQGRAAGLDAGARPLPATQGGEGGPRGRPMVLTKPELIASSAERGPHPAAPREQDRPLDARLPSLAEAAQHARAAKYLSVMGPSLVQAEGRSVRPGRWTEAMKTAGRAGFRQTLAAIAAHGDAYATLLGGRVDADLRAEIDLFGKKNSRGLLHRLLVLCGCAAYRPTVVCTQGLVAARI